jgi:AcrR family transcriptional regulator
VTTETEPDLTQQRPRGPYRKGVQKRQKIVAAAAEVFAEFGYRAGSLRTIGDRVGMSSASLIQYFGSKEGLLDAVLQDWNRRVDRVARSPAEATNGLQGQDLRGLAWFNRGREMMRYHVKHRAEIELFITVTSEATSDSHPARTFVHDRYASTVADFQRHFLEAITDGEVQPMSEAEIEQEMRVHIAVMDGLEVQWLIDPAIDLVGLFERHLDQTIARWQQP